MHVYIFYTDVLHLVYFSYVLNTYSMYVRMYVRFVCLYVCIHLYVVFIFEIFLSRNFALVTETHSLIN